MLTMKKISKSTLRNTKLFVLSRELRMMIYGIWMRLDFGRIVVERIGL